MNMLILQIERGLRVMKGCVQRQLQERDFAATRQSSTGNLLDAFVSSVHTCNQFMDGWIAVESMKDAAYSQNIIPEPEPFNPYERNCLRIQA